MQYGRKMGMIEDVNIWTTVEHSLFHLYKCWNVVSTWDTSGSWRM